jgi:hypothetical protein
VPLPPTLPVLLAPVPLVLGDELARVVEPSPGVQAPGLEAGAVAESAVAEVGEDEALAVEEPVDVVRDAAPDAEAAEQLVLEVVEEPPACPVLVESSGVGRVLDALVESILVVGGATSVRVADVCFGRV